MGAQLHEFFGDHGAAVVFVTTFLSCLGLPIPAALILFGSGAFAAIHGEGAGLLFPAAYAGAIGGGVAVFVLGRSAGGFLLQRLSARPAMAPLIDRARDLVAQRGGTAVFLGSSLVAQVGPAVMLVAGAARLGWAPFMVWQLMGRLLWVAGYMVLGWVLSDQVLRLTTTGG